MENDDVVWAQSKELLFTYIMCGDSGVVVWCLCILSYVCSDVQQAIFARPLVLKL